MHVLSLFPREEKSYLSLELLYRDQPLVIKFSFQGLHSHLHIEQKYVLPLVEKTSYATKQLLVFTKMQQKIH